MPHGTVNDPRIFVSIAPDGIVTIVAHRAEMGTGVRTSLPMIVADEMEADWARVRVQQAPGDEAKYGNQDTDGSRSTRHYLHADAPGRRRRPHDAREAAAAKRWNVPVDRGEGEQPRGRARRERPAARVTANSPRTPRRSRCRNCERCSSRIRRTSATSARARIGIVDLRDITMGKAMYGADITAARHEIRGDRPPAGRRAASWCRSTQRTPWRSPGSSR